MSMNFTNFLHSTNPQYSVLQQKKHNMQFKVVSALAFVTLVAAGAVPPQAPPPASSLPPPTNTDLPPPPPGTNHPPPPPNGLPPRAAPNTNPANTNTNTNASKIAPPFPGNPLPTIAASKCTTGHLRCCKSAQSPTAASVSPLLTPFGISPSTISGLVGITCTEIPVTGAGPRSCSEQPVCCTDNSFGDTLSLGCNLVNLS